MDADQNHSHSILIRDLERVRRLNENTPPATNPSTSSGQTVAAGAGADTVAPAAGA